jgi:[acyl-carrier-protein] S-malonyltransferase
MNSSYAIVFPGQGSQSIKMLASIANQYSEIKETYDQASQVLDYDLWALTQEGPAEKLDQTVYTQPAILAGSYAIWRIIKKRFDSPSVLAGHSLGEYTALVCAESLDFSDAIKLVAARGQFMQEAISQGMGAMAAIIGLNEEAVLSICKQALFHQDDILEPANFNSPGQIVIAGHKKSVERALVLSKEQGAKLAVLLPVSVPSHCRLMLPAAEKLQNLLAETVFKKLRIPVINNADVKQYDSHGSICDGLTRQLYSPVRWVETIETMVSMGVTEIIECGPGQVLTGLNKRINKNFVLKTTAELETLEKLIL